MPREIKMPKLSDTMEEGTLNVWRKREGERIEKGDILLEVETDKADMEFEAYMSGTLARILVPSGQTVAVGTPIAVVKLDSDTDADLQAFLAARESGGAGVQPAAQPAVHAATAPAAQAAAPSAAPSAAPRPAPPAARVVGPQPSRIPSAFAASAAPRAAAAPAPAPAAAAGEGPFVPARPIELTSRLPFYLPDPDRVRATPRARALAQERSVDLSEIAGSGPDGAVVVSDIERYLEALETQEAPPLEGDVHATPVAVRIAEEMHIDLARVKGTGPGGRITKRDLRSHLEREAREGPTREMELYGDEIKLSQKRKFLIRNMVESKKNAPHFYVQREVDAEPLRRVRDALKDGGKHVTYTHLILKASALALERFPEVNATFRDDRILRFNPINIAVAVDVQDELVAPVVKDCQGRDVEDLAQATDTLIRKARERKLAPDDYAGGTFTISNLGMFGVETFYAIITPPQSMVLSVGSLRSVPVATEDGQVRIGRRMSFGLAVDHRVLDGVKAAQFLEELCRLIEHPEELLGSGAKHGA